MALNIDWASLTPTQHGAVFNVLADLHADVIGRVKVEEGRDNTELFAIAHDLNRVMHAGNDDLVRRTHRFENTNCDCGVCP